MAKTQDDALQQTDFKYVQHAFLRKTKYEAKLFYGLFIGCHAFGIPNW